jgi:hypothetical protein
MRLLALLASVVIATPAVADEGDLTMREDPTTKRHYFLDPDRLVSDVMIGWAFTAEAGKDVDYARAEYDGEYLLQQVGDGSNVVNVLVDTKSDRIIADLDNEKAAYEACWAAGGSATNHCDISVEYSSSTRLAIVVLDSKWYTNAVRLYRLRPFRTGLRVQASADLLARSGRVCACKRAPFCCPRSRTTPSRDSRWCTGVSQRSSATACRSSMRSARRHRAWSATRRARSR